MSRRYRNTGSLPPRTPAGPPPPDRHALCNHLMVVLFHAEAIAHRLAGTADGPDADALLRSAQAIHALLVRAEDSEAA